MNFLVDPLIDPTTYMVFTKGAGARCDHFKWEMRTRVHAHLNLACVRPKKGSQLTPCLFNRLYSQISD